MMYRSQVFALVVGVAFQLAPKLASSQTATGPPCVERTQLVQLLREAYGEQVVARGLVSGGLVLEVYASAAGTWTIVATAPTGMSCLLADGVAWVAVAPPDHAL